MTVSSEISLALNRLSSGGRVDVGQIAANPQIVVSVDSVLTTDKNLSADPSIVLTVGSALTTTKNLSADPSIVLTVGSALTTTANISADPQIVVSVGSALTTTKNLSANPSIVLTASSEIKRAIIADPSIVLTASSEIKRAIIADPSIVLTADSTLTVTGGSFDLASITGYYLDLYPTSLAGTYTDGDTLNSTDGFPDETGTWDFNQIDGSPVYNEDELNGESTIDLVSGDADRFRDLTNQTWQNTFSMVYVINVASSASQWFIYRTSAADVYMLKRSDDDFNFLASNDTLSMSTGDFAPSAGVGSWAIIIATVDFPNGALNLYINGSLEGSGSGTGNTDAPPAQYINIPANTGYPTMQFARHIIYMGHILTTQERSDLFTDLGTLYGITVS